MKTLKIICLVLLLTVSAMAQEEKPAPKLNKRYQATRNSPALYTYSGLLDGQQRAAGMAQAPDGSAVQLSETVPAESRVTIYGKSLNGQVSHVWLKSEDREEVVPVIGVYVQPYFGWEMMSFRLPPGWTGLTEIRAESWGFRSNVVWLDVQ